MFLITYIVLCLIVAWCAKGSRGGPIVYFFASLIVTPLLALLFLVLLSEKTFPKDSDMG